MTVVGLHPEDLFDKLLDGELTAAEGERLRAHLAVCDVCRFEHAARLDFQAEALELSALAPPSALPLRPASPGVVRQVASPSRRRRSRWVVWGLSAAALISASGALAAVGLSGKAPWKVASPLFVPSAKSSERLAPAAGRRAAVRRALNGALAPAVVEQLPATREVDVVVERALPAVTSSASAPRAARERNVEKRIEREGNVEPPVAARVDQPPVVPVQTSSRSAPIVRGDEVKEPAREPLTAAKLFGDANQARRSGDVGRASGLYHLLQDQFPGSPEAELSRVTLALLLLDSGDAQGALGGFERYLAGPSRGLEAEALVGRARALARLGRRDLEIAAWREVQRKYARSVYGRQASERLAALGQP
jgi:hypothetical protein